MGFGGWSLQYKTLQLMRVLAANKGSILEFGSGEGTNELAKHFTVTSVEHDFNWLGVCPSSNYIHAPLQSNEDGTQWYSTDILKDKLPKEVDIIFVDGPPGFIGREPFIDNLDMMPVYKFLILDDTERESERKLVDKIKDKTGLMPISFKCNGREFTLFCNQSELLKLSPTAKKEWFQERCRLRFGPFEGNGHSKQFISDMHKERGWMFNEYPSPFSESIQLETGAFSSIEEALEIAQDCQNSGLPLVDIVSDSDLSPIINAKDDMKEIRKKWSQKGNILTLKAEELDVNFEMPDEWEFENTHPDLFRLAEFVLRHPWDKTLRDDWNPSRKPGSMPALAFSGGVDSTAAMCVMPTNTILGYHQRNFESLLDHTNAIRMIEHLRSKGKTIHMTKSNHELIRTFHGKSAGFSSDYACAVHLILLADYLDIGSIAVGMPLENSYLFGGYKYRSFTNTWFWKLYAPLFKSVGLQLIQPISGCSEILTMKIVQSEGLEEYAQSCLRSSSAGQVCGKCWKCFRKNSLLGLPWQMSNEIKTFLAKRPLKMAVSTLYSIQKMIERGENIDWLDEYPDLLELIEKDYSWLENHFKMSEELIPRMYKDEILEKIHAIGQPIGIDSPMVGMKLFEEVE